MSYFSPLMLKLLAALFEIDFEGTACFLLIYCPRDFKFHP